ncbi:LysR family transcriptional regulator [Lentzea sp. E54]|uniref:LysR family transcriptional regulator n=1 Tax=Lentzea xerophila TaxID=3435883 RepID=UPI003DA2E694
MEIRHLRYFAAVADTCHFGQAAKRLNMAQPALSHAIRQLEDELGVCLLLRTTRRVELTDAGRFFLDEALHMLNRIDAGIHGVRLLSAGRSGLVRIGLTGAVAFAHMPLLVQSIRKKLPGVEFEVHADLSTREQCDKLREETLDLGVVHPPVHRDDVELRIIGDEPLILALPADHPLTAKESTTVADLRDEPFITGAEAESGIADPVLQMCLNAGFHPRKRHEASSMPMLLALVAAGLGIGVVPASARSVPLPGIVFRCLGGVASVQVALAWNRSKRSRVVANLLKVLVDEMPTLKVAIKGS